MDIKLGLRTGGPWNVWNEKARVVIEREGCRNTRIFDGRHFEKLKDRFDTFHDFNESMTEISIILHLTDVVSYRIFFFFNIRSIEALRKNIRWITFGIASIGELKKYLISFTWSEFDDDWRYSRETIFFILFRIFV